MADVKTLKEKHDSAVGTDAHSLITLNHTLEILRSVRKQITYQADAPPLDNQIVLIEKIIFGYKFREDILGEKGVVPTVEVTATETAKT